MRIKKHQMGKLNYLAYYIHVVATDTLYMYPNEAIQRILTGSILHLLDLSIFFNEVKFLLHLYFPVTFLQAYQPPMTKLSVLFTMPPRPSRKLQYTVTSTALEDLRSKLNSWNSINLQKIDIPVSRLINDML